MKISKDKIVRLCKIYQNWIYFWFLVGVGLICLVLINPPHVYFFNVNDLFSTDSIQALKPVVEVSKTTLETKLSSFSPEMERELNWIECLNYWGYYWWGVLMCFIKTKYTFVNVWGHYFWDYLVSLLKPEFIFKPGIPNPKYFRSFPLENKISPELAHLGNYVISTYKWVYYLPQKGIDFLNYRGMIPDWVVTMVQAVPLDTDVSFSSLKSPEMGTSLQQVASSVHTSTPPQVGNVIEQAISIKQGVPLAQTSEMTTSAASFILEDHNINLSEFRSVFDNIEH